MIHTLLYSYCRLFIAVYILVFSVCIVNTHFMLKAPKTTEFTNCVDLREAPHNEVPCLDPQFAI